MEEEESRVVSKVENGEALEEGAQKMYWGRETTRGHASSVLKCFKANEKMRRNKERWLNALL